MSDISPVSNSFNANNRQSDSTFKSGAASSLSSEFRNLVGDVEEFITSTTSLTGQDLERAKQKLLTRIETAREALEEVGETIVDRSRRVASATNEYVYERPWTAVGVGAATGFVLGVMYMRRN